MASASISRRLCSCLAASGLLVLDGCDGSKGDELPSEAVQESPITQFSNVPGSIDGSAAEPMSPLVIVGSDEMQVTPDQLVSTGAVPTMAQEEQLRLSVGRRLLSSGDFAGAEAVFRALHASHPDHPRAIFLLGLSIHKQKRYAEARPLLERSDALASSMDGDVVAVIFPEAAHVSHFLGWCTYYLGDLDASARHFDAHIALVPSEFDSQFGRGVVAIDQDDIGTAERHLRAALQLLDGPGADGQPAMPRPKDRAKVLVRLGDVSLRRDQVDEARTRYEEAVALWPAHHEGWAKLARVLDRLNQPESAAQAREQQQRVLEQLGRLGGGGANQ